MTKDLSPFGFTRRRVLALGATTSAAALLATSASAQLRLDVTQGNVQPVVAGPEQVRAKLPVAENRMRDPVAGREPDFLRGEIHTRWLDELLRRPRSAASFANGEDQDTGAFDAATIAAAIWHATQSSAASFVTPPADAGPSRWKLEGRRQQLDRTP